MESYPVDFLVDYNNNSEYRQCIRKLFNMDELLHLPTVTPIEELDNETQDELTYDEVAAAILMDFVFSKTENNILFQRIYDSAAALMLSTERSIGLTIVYSYDYFADFHRCLVAFFKEPNTFNDSLVCYTRLLSKLETK